ncbi:MAG: hypothetical protein CUN52_15510, partial [Phototrophicales bacterium]
MVYDLDPQTAENIHKAQHINGIPPQNRLVPFRNMRHVLSLHAKTAPDKPYLIHLDKDGNREMLTYAEFNARVHQTANFLYDDCGVRRGDR